MTKLYLMRRLSLWRKSGTTIFSRPESGLAWIFDDGGNSMARRTSIFKTRTWFIPCFQKHRTPHQRSHSVLTIVGPRRPCPFRIHNGFYASLAIRASLGYKKKHLFGDLPTQLPPIKRPWELGHLTCPFPSSCGLNALFCIFMSYSKLSSALTNLRTTILTKASRQQQ